MTPFVFSLLINNAPSDPIGRERDLFVKCLINTLAIQRKSAVYYLHLNGKLCTLTTKQSFRKSAAFSNSAESTTKIRRLYAFDNGFHGADEPTQGQQLAWVSAPH